MNLKSKKRFLLEGEKKPNKIPACQNGKTKKVLVSVITPKRGAKAKNKIWLSVNWFPQETNSWKVGSFTGEMTHLQRYSV